MIQGQCHCGAVRYELTGEALHHNALCHCTDCRRHSGAPMVAWGLVNKDQIAIEGETKEYASSEHGRRHFCPECGTGLFYYNEAFLPGIVDIQSATFDNPEDHAPQVHVQYAEHLAWMDGIDGLPKFARYPGQEDQGPEQVVP